MTDVREGDSSAKPTAQNASPSGKASLSGLVLSVVRGLFARLRRRPEAVLLLPECLAIGGLIALAWLTLWMPLAQERLDAERTAIESTSNLARAFEENTDRIVSGIDQILLSARAAYAENEAGFDIRDWVSKRVHTDKFAFFIGRIDEHGISRESTSKPAPPPFDLSDREHFRFHLDPTRDALYISQPLVGRYTGKPAIQFTRKMLHADGSFAGVVQVSLDADELSRFYETLEIGNGFVMLAGTDGVVRARGPRREGVIGATITQPAVLQAVQSQWQGSFVMTSPEDGVTRTVSFRRLITYPLVVLIGFDQADVLQHYLDARRHALLTGIIITAIALLLGSFWIDQRRRWLVSSRSLRVTLENMNQGIVMIDSAGRAPVVNRRAVELLHLPDDMIAQPGVRRILPWQVDRDGRLTAEHAALLMPPGAPAEDLDRSAVFENVDGDGKIIEVQTHAVPTGGMVLTYTDVTDRRLAEARIRHLAHHDALTGLPNRVLLHERVAEAISRAKADESMFAVLCLDLDGFKGVNDTMGHDAGDLLLVRFAERLRVAVRPTDTVARTGGDEFAIVLRDLSAPDDAERLIGRLLETLVDPVRIEGTQFAVATSIGVAVYPSDGLEVRSLMKNADTALYRAKAEGRGTYRFFEPSMDEQLKEKRAIEQDLRGALERDELEVYFQPQFACDTLVVVGFEALIRWNHPTRGFVPPGIFIPIAEECGLIVAVGRVALQKACAYASQWRPRYRIAVNLSPIQFRDERLAALLDDTLQRTGLPADLLELEVTEGVLIGDEAQALAILHDLKGRGLRIALDDFGTGYSSLSYLRRFPFDKIKIDKSFVQAQQYDPGSQAIMEAVLTMSARLNLDVTVEGVETDEQLTMVQRQRCSEVQGFLLGRPMPAEDVPRFLEFEARVPEGWDAPPHVQLLAHAEPENVATVSDAAD